VIREGAQSASSLACGHAGGAAEAAFDHDPRARLRDAGRRRLCSPITPLETPMSTPQTPDSLKKSREEQAPPQKPQGDAPDRLSDDSGDRAEPRQGGH